MPLFHILTSAIRGYLWPTSKHSAIPANLPKWILVSGAVCSGICVALSLAAILTVQIAFWRVDRNNHLGLSQDGFHAMSGWAYLTCDLVHVYVIGVFAFWLARSLCWEAWLGGTALIIAALGDFGSLSVNMFLQAPALSALAHGQSVGTPDPEAGYDLICSTLNFAQASFAMVGSFFLAGAAVRGQGMARVVGWFLIAGFMISIFQIAEIGLHTFWTDLVDDWVTPVGKMAEHLVIAICLWGLFGRKDLYSDSQSTLQLSKKAVHVAS
jgi:hypothetical protein